MGAFDDLFSNCVKHAKAMGEIEKRLEKGRKKMNILVACEESQAVCIELRRLGHIAFSCDLESCSGGHPEWHIQADVLPLIDGHCEFTCADGGIHHITDRWDMILAFPPCTHLCGSGARWWSEKQKDGRQQQAIEFFMKFVNADCEKIAIENPVGLMSTKYRKPDQIINPYEFGDPECKKTCLWLKGLPKLKATDIVPKELRQTSVWLSCFDGKKIPWGSPECSKLRSKTFPGNCPGYG